MSTEKHIGTCIGYRRSGYGWLDCNGVRIWVHIQDCRDYDGHLMAGLKVGLRMKFEIVEEPKGLRAINARAVEKTIAPTTEAISCPQTTS
jgi:cold shock CspA family protein